MHIIQNKKYYNNLHLIFVPATNSFKIFFQDYELLKIVSISNDLLKLLMILFSKNVDSNKRNLSRQLEKITVQPLLTYYTFISICLLWHWCCYDNAS